jgi:hypothetical protein
MEIKGNRLLFMDYLNITLAYLGDSAQTITISSADNATENITLNFPGNPIQRTSTITYLNGEYENQSAGYEVIRSFAIATTMVTDDVLRYWLDQKNATDGNGNLLYPEGPLKAALEHSLLHCLWSTVMIWWQI